MKIILATTPYLSLIVDILLDTSTINHIDETSIYTANCAASQCSVTSQALYRYQLSNPGASSAEAYYLQYAGGDNYGGAMCCGDGSRCPTSTSTSTTSGTSSTVTETTQSTTTTEPWCVELNPSESDRSYSAVLSGSSFYGKSMLDSNGAWYLTCALLV